METVWIILAFWLGVCAGFVLLAILQISRESEDTMPIPVTMPEGSTPHGVS